MRVDVFNSLLERGDRPDRQDPVQKLGVVILGGGGDGGLEMRGGLFVGSDLHPGLAQGRAQDGKQVAEPLAMNQQRLAGIAGGRIVSLRIDADGHRLALIGISIDINRAEPIGMAKNGNTSRLLDGLHQLIRAAGNDQVDPAIEIEHLPHLLSRRDELNRIRRHPIHLAESLLDDRDQGLVRSGGLPAALENDGVGGFKREGGDLHGRLGPRLENNADDSKRTAYPVEIKPLSEPRREGHLSDRVRQPGDVANPGQHGIELAPLEIKTLEQSPAQAAGFNLSLAVRLVGAVSLQDVFAPLLQLAPDRLEGGILALGRERRQLQGGGPRPPGDGLYRWGLFSFFCAHVLAGPVKKIPLRINDSGRCLKGTRLPRQAH